MQYFPRHLNIETSDYCNRSCDYCPIQRDRESKPPQRLDFALYCKLLDSLAEAPVDLKISLQWIDEPLANPSFLDYARVAKERVPGAVWLLQTNGDYLTSALANELETLFDAIVINAYTKSAYDRLKEIELEVEWATRSRAIQSPGRLRGKDGFEAQRDVALFHINQKFQDRDWVEAYAPDLVPPSTPCTKLYEQITIAYNGDVHLCCRDHLKAAPVGNIANASLFSIYNNEKSVALRDAMEQGRRDLSPMCHRCEGRAKKPVYPLAGTLHALGLPLSNGRPHDDNRTDTLRSLEHKHQPEDLARPVSTVVQQQAPPRAERPRPWGHYDYLGGRQLSQLRGDVVLPGFLPLRYEFVAGLSPASTQKICDILLDNLGHSLVAVWVCGSRVIPRHHLKKVDPSVFVAGGGTLAIGQKGHLREYGKDPTFSSDLDLKVFVRADSDFPMAEGSAAGLHSAPRHEDDPAGAMADLELSLGKALEDAVPFLPVSGHPTPRVRLLPTTQADPRLAFEEYNAARRQTFGKGPLSLSYTQLLFDAGQPLAWKNREDVMEAVVRAALDSVDATPRPLKPLRYAPEFDALDRDERWRQVHNGITGHQLVGALLDHPHLSPRGVRVEGNVVVNGSLAVWAARMAGRESLAI